MIHLVLARRFELADSTNSASGATTLIAACGHAFDSAIERFEHGRASASLCTGVSSYTLAAQQERRSAANLGG